MSDASQQTQTAFSRTITAAVIVIAGGMIVLVLGIGLDWGGIWGGFGLGVGIGLALVGAYLLGFANGLRRPKLRGSWLPSRDARP